MEPSTELIDSVNALLKQGYRSQLLFADFAVLAKPQPDSSIVKIVTVSGDGKVNSMPLSEFLETIIHG
jgi:hypothetical protein